LPADHPQILATQLNLAGTRRQLGDHAGAAALFEHVHATWERMLPPDHANLIGVKLNLALARRSVGDLAGARELLEEVHSGWQQRLPEDHPELLAAKIDLAGVLLASGERDRARELLEHVHAVRARVLSSDDPQLLEAQQDLCAVLVAEGAHGRLRELCGALLAGQSARSASVSTLATRVARTAALRELERLAWVASWSEIADEPGAPALAPALFEVLEGLRLVSTSSAQVSSALARSTQLAALHASLGEARRELSNASQTPPSAAAELESWRDQLVALAEKRDGLERDLRRELAAHGARVELPTVEALASRLAGDQVYVGFWRCLRHRSASPGSLEYTATDALRAFVVRSDGSVALVELGAAAPLEALATRWRAALGKPIERGIEDPSSADDTELAAGQALRAALLDPVFAALGDGELRTLFVVPDDFVHVVPLDALPRADGTLLGESIAVRVEPSAARLTREAPVFDSNGTLVAFGGVDFSATEVEPAVHAVSVATPAHERSSSTGFAPLLSSRIEAQFAATLYQDHVGAEPLLRLGKEASEATLVALAPRARYLHIATHGWFAERSKAVSMLDAFEGGANAVGRLAVERTQETIVGFLPETLCGLALAGANHGPEGILTAEELATLDLANCELAVLSACETNVGIRRAGQGIQSLQTALHAAGARTAITSLWKVDDAATRRLFELFYTKLWSENLGPADALWQAKMALKGEGHPTRDWAGWVLTGVGD
jgi:CHAT domain-containing protein